MNIFKKLLDVGKSNEEEVVEENIFDEILQTKEENLKIKEEINEVVENNELNNWMKNKKNIEIIEKYKNEIEKIVDNFNKNKKEELVDLIEKLIKKEKNINVDLTKNLINKKDLEKQKVDIDILQKLLEDFLELKEIQEIKIYEEFLDSQSYIIINKINDVFIKIKSSNLNEEMYEKLGDIIKIYEEDILEKTLKDVEMYKQKVEELIGNTKELTKDITKLVNMINASKKQGQIEYKRQHEKISRLQTSLVKKREELVKEEENLNNKLERINQKIKKCIEEFYKVLNFLTIYVEEKQVLTEDLINEYTLNIAKDKKNINIENIKNNIEKLKNLKEIIIK